MRQIFVAVLTVLAWVSPAAALTLEVEQPPPSLVGDTITLTAVVGDAMGAAQTYRWDFGDGPRIEDTIGLSQVEHTYTEPGVYSVLVLVRDVDAEGMALPGAFKSVVFQHIVHYPLLPVAPRNTSDIIYDELRQRVYNVNPDNDTISAVDAVGLTKVAELPVYQDPRALAIAPDGKLWVVHRDDYAVAIVDLDTFQIERGFRLPYASQPMGLVMSPTDDAAYITLMALGKVLKLNPISGEILGEVDVGSWARGIAVSHDGLTLYVTRFITTGDQGEVVQVDTSTLSVAARWGLEHDPGLIEEPVIPRLADGGLAPADAGTLVMNGPDTDRAGRGLPNYLFAVALSPDGTQAWIPAKKDNIKRGPVRDGLDLNQENTVRPMLAVIDPSNGQELPGRRTDIDDRNLPTHITFGPLGTKVFVSITGSNQVEVRDAYQSHADGNLFAGLKDAGMAPMGTVLGPDGVLFVHGYLSRNVLAFDATGILSGRDPTRRLLADIPVVENEKLDAEVLQGKRIFYFSEDKRMTQEGYLSCATCHFDGFEDGRVWDFTHRGEGFRNTISLLGRRGTGHGNLLWSGGFDEVQDLENEIRDLFSGSGFLQDEVFVASAVGQPLGTPKAGRSEDLDALAAYVESLDHVNPSPFRNPDGTLTPDGLAGKELFSKLGCDFCHVGKDFTDSARGMLHDVGTIKETSGFRLGGPLEGIDTPTLLGVWETAPYLHDGSAATLRDVLTTQNPEGKHGFTEALSDQEIDQLVAYMLQIDSELPPRRLPFEPPLPETGTDAGVPANADAGTHIDPTTTPAEGDPKSCGCRVPGEPGRGSLLLVLGPLLGWVWRRRQSKGAVS